MTIYKTGRSTDYAGAEAPPKRQYPLRKIDTTAYRPADFGHAISHRKNGGANHYRGDTERGNEGHHGTDHTNNR